MSTSTSTLGVVAKARDEVTGPMRQAAAAFAAASSAVAAANTKVAQSERVKRTAMQAAREAQRQAQAQAQAMRDTLSGLSGALSAMAESAGVGAKGVAGIEAAMRGGVLAFRAMRAAAEALLSGLVDTATKGRDFELMMARIATVVNDADRNMGLLHQASLKMAGFYGQSPVAQAESLYEAIQAGAFDARDAINVLDVANKLSVAGVSDVRTAIDGLTSIVNAYGLSMSEAMPIADAMFIAVRDGKTSIQELTGAFGRVASTAHSVGMSLDEAMASVAAITAQGIATDEAITALNNALIKLLKPGKQATEEMQRLNIEFSAAGMAKAGGFLGLLKQITTAAGYNSGSLAKLFGNIRGIRGAMALVNNDGQKFIEILEHMADKAGATDRAFALISDTFKFQADRALALRDAIQVTFGELMVKSDVARGALDGFNTAMTIVLHGLTDMQVESGATREELARFIRLAIAQAIEALGSMMVTVGNVIKSFREHYDTISTLTSAYSKLIVWLLRIQAPFASVEAVVKMIGRDLETVKTMLGEEPPSAPLEDTLIAAGHAAQALAQKVREGVVSTEMLAKAEQAQSDQRKKELQAIIDLEARRLAQERAASGDKEAAKRAKKAETEAEKTHAADLREVARMEREAARAEAAAERRQAQEAAKRADEDVARSKAAVKRAEQIARETFAGVADTTRTDFQKSEEEKWSAIGAAASVASAGLLGVFAAMIDTSEEVSAAIKKMVANVVADLAKLGVMKLLEGAFGIAGTALGGPIGGLVGGLAGLGASQLFHRGGVVQRARWGVLAGGRPGQDSIPVLAQEGEAFLDRSTTDTLRRLLRAGPPSASAQPVPVASGGAGGAVNVNVSTEVRTMAPPSAADLERYVRDVTLRALRSLHAGGHLAFIGAR